MRKRILVLLMGVLFTPWLSAQQVYKWVDSKGKVHYGDIPTSRKTKKVDTRDRMKGANGKSGKTCPEAK